MSYLSPFNDLTEGHYESLPQQVGTINSVLSTCGEYRVFKYPSKYGKMITHEETAIFGDFVFVECSVASLELVGVGQYKDNFDLWAKHHCEVICEAVQPE